MSTLTNTGTLLRFEARRDRVRGPIWVLSISLFVPYVMSAYATVLTNPSDKQAILAMLTNPVMRLFSGPGYGLDSRPNDVPTEVIFAGVYWVYLLVIVGLMNILLISRHTRREEQDGRAELLLANVLGRHAPLTAALLLAAISNVAVGALVTLGLVGFGAAAGSAVLLGAGTAIFGCVFAALTAVTAQLSAYSSGASGLAGALLGAAFMLRGLGDLLAPLGQYGTWLSWLSPFGWVQQTAPFVLDRWWPLLLAVAATAALVASAFWLQRRRDLGAGLLQARSGSATAPAWLGRPLSVSWVVLRRPAGWWAFGLGLAAVVYGSFTGAMVDAFADLPDLLRNLMGGATGAISGYVTLTNTMFRIALAAYVVLAIGTLRAEEAAGRLEPVLAGPVRVGQWLDNGIIIIVATATVIAMGLGAVSGGFAAAADGDGVWFGRGIVAGAVGIPAIAMVTGLAALLYAAAPRWLALAWIPVIVAGLVDVFGDLIQAPGWLRQLSVFEYTPHLPAESFEALPLVVQTLIAAALVLAAVWTIGRRNIPAL